MPLFLFSCFVFLSLLTLGNCGDFYDGLENIKSQSHTFLTNAATRSVFSIEVQNKGDKSTDQYVIGVPKSLADNLSKLEAVDESNGEHLHISRLHNLKFASNFESDTSVNDAIYYSFPLPKTLTARSDDTVNIKLSIIYIHLLQPLPAEIKKSGKQYMVYEGNRYFYSPYFTHRHAAKYTLASDKIKSYTKPGSLKEKKITYGPYNDLSPLSVSDVKFHFQFHNPYLTMTEVSRDIEISHWGNVKLVESFQLQHSGARLKGAYEPGIMDRMFQSGDPSVVTQLKATLPRSAHGVYYVDRIGNVSTSHFRTGSKASYLELRPRYPLYGGWKTDFEIGYDVPSQDLIKLDPITNIHTLNVSFGLPFREPVTDLLITTIALPEGAYDVEFDGPFGIEMEDTNEDGTPLKRFTYLDTQLFGGRTMIRFHKKNVVSLHNEYFQVRYKYNKNQVYFKPLLVISGIFIAFITIMIFRRFNPALDTEMEKELRNKTLQSHAPPVKHASKHGKNGGWSQISELISKIDTDSDTNSILQSVKKARNIAKKSNEKSLLDRLQSAYDQAKQHKKDKAKFVKIIEDLKKEF